MAMRINVRMPMECRRDKDHSVNSALLTLAHLGTPMAMGGCEIWKEETFVYRTGHLIGTFLNIMPIIH
jgi:hypothetical protein